MARAKSVLPKNWSLGDLLKHFGEISPERIRLRPYPGTATERDVTHLSDHEDRLYELADGVLVEKVTGLPESVVAVELISRLSQFVRERKLGIVTGEGGTLRLMPGLVRIPDVAFIGWDRLPGKTVPAEAIPDLAPDLAVEVLSEGNSKQEMERKLKDYFFNGVRLVWYINPKKRNAEVFTSPDQGATVTEHQALEGGDVLPGFRLLLRELFAELAPPGRKRNGRKKSS
ncbi:MAG TPA: Uma2 family endonuclease [Gemmataceae bacterium]|nr:Uma2 family endonuclease [Gemmataceae bacterium]